MFKETRSIMDYLKDDCIEAWKNVTEDTFGAVESIGKLLSSLGFLFKILLHLVQAGMVDLKNETLEHKQVFLFGVVLSAAALVVIYKATKNDTDIRKFKEEIDE